MTCLIVFKLGACNNLQPRSVLHPTRISQSVNMTGIYYYLQRKSSCGLVGGACFHKVRTQTRSTYLVLGLEHLDNVSLL